jgi:hypothetical protein
MAKSKKEAVVGTPEVPGHVTHIHVSGKHKELHAFPDAGANLHALSAGCVCRPVKDAEGVYIHNEVKEPA